MLCSELVLRTVNGIGLIGIVVVFVVFFFFQAEDGIRDVAVTGVQTCALPISKSTSRRSGRDAPWRTRPREWSWRPRRPSPRPRGWTRAPAAHRRRPCGSQPCRSEEHTSELQSRLHLVCRLLLEKKRSKARSTP